MIIPHYVKNFSNGVNIPRLKKEIGSSSIMIGLIEINDLATRIDIEFEDNLSNDDRSFLNTILADHDGAPDSDSAVNNLTATTDPTVNDDIDAGYSKGSSWINTTPTEKGFLCLNAAKDAAVWIDITQLSSTSKTVIHSPCNTDTIAYLSTVLSTYVVQKPTILYGGSTALGAITKIEARVQRMGGTSIDIKIFDFDNSNVIVEKTGITNTSMAILDLGSISNIPSSPATLEIQIRRTGAGGEARVSGVSITL